MAWVWLILANVVLFGVVRYIARSKEVRHHKGVNWDGYDAVAITIAVYLVAQLAAALLLGVYLAATGSGSAEELLNTSVTTQFFYILLVELLTLGSLHYVLKLRGNGLKMLGLSKPAWRDVGYTFIGFGIYVPALLIGLQIVQALVPSINLDQQQQIGFESAQGGMQLFFVFCSLVILPPITEEILTRGFLYLGLKKHMKKIYAVLLTSVMFALAHLQFGSGAPLLWAAAIDTFILSLVLIYIRDATNKLWAPIGLHALKNFVAFMALFVFKV